MKKEIFSNKEYFNLLNEIKSRVISARIHAARSLSKDLIRLYWDIGKSIVEKQEKYKWGEGIVEQLSRDITREFENYKGFSPHNLWRMRMFYLVYRYETKLAQLVLEVPWGHNILIMQKTKNTNEKEYYLTASLKFGWSRNVLLNQIKADAYKLSLKQKSHNFKLALPSHLSEQAEESLKSVYNLDFLGISHPVIERELEKRLIEKMKYFILELGLGFSFIGNQYRLELDGEEYFIDLLFFNRRLKCLFAAEIKTGKFKPEYAGKMDFYLNLLNEQVRFPDENPSIGIILCADKSNITVEFALRSVKNPMGVAQYHLTTKLPKQLKGVLPSEVEFKKEISKELK